MGRLQVCQRPKRASFISTKKSADSNPAPTKECQRPKRASFISTFTLFYGFCVGGVCQRPKRASFISTSEERGATRVHLLECVNALNGLLSFLHISGGERRWRKRVSTP